MYFQKRFGIDADWAPSLADHRNKLASLDIELAASGFSKEDDDVRNITA